MMMNKRTALVVFCLVGVAQSMGQDTFSISSHCMDAVKEAWNIEAQLEDIDRNHSDSLKVAVLIGIPIAGGTFSKTKKIMDRIATDCSAAGLDFVIAERQNLDFISYVQAWHGYHNETDLNSIQVEKIVPMCTISLQTALSDFRNFAHKLDENLTRHPEIVHADLVSFYKRLHPLPEPLPGSRLLVDNTINGCAGRLADKGFKSAAIEIMRAESLLLDLLDTAHRNVAKRETEQLVQAILSNQRPSEDRGHPVRLQVGEIHCAGNVVDHGEILGRTLFWDCK